MRASQSFLTKLLKRNQTNARYLICYNIAATYGKAFLPPNLLPNNIIY